jgi:pyruvate/2-oxoglutarate dehydrogenase complex dihydrolipoamide acyltransferase (E2) component
VESIPTDNIENFVVGTAQGVGKALETVAETIDKELFHPGSPPKPPAAAAAPPAAAEAAATPAASNDPSAATPAAPAAPPAVHDDAYAPEPPKGS